MTEPLYLGIEGGGTRTTAVFATRHLQVTSRTESGPGNYRLLNPESLRKLFSEIAQPGFSPVAVGIGLAGVRDETDRLQVRSAAESVWRGIPIVVTHDLEIALAAAVAEQDVFARVLVLSGTGSCCYGENSRGETAKIGGWGHLLGDVGSGYDIALRALRSAIYEYDRYNRWNVLGRNIVRALLVNSADDLIPWAQNAAKSAIARLAPVVFEAAASRDPVARRILADVAAHLSSDALICARRIARQSEQTAFVLAGSVLQNQLAFARRVGNLIRQNRPRAKIQIAAADGAIGAVKLAIAAQSLPQTRGKPRVLSPASNQAERYVPAFNPLESPTEARNPKSLKLDKLSITEAIALMLHADTEVVPALRKEQKQIERAVRLASASLKRGGRIFYVGSGTSGRLGVLDASECPPTFRASPEMIQGIIAGGQTALWQAVEGAEDDWNSGAASIRSHQVSPRDIVIGIAASGRTPFVWGALEEARKNGSRTVLICFNPALKIDPNHRPDVVIAPNVGPELLTGSTRLKCGTATKLILNMISTISMVRLGKVMSNLMIDLNPSNVKLRDRAVRIVSELTGCTADEARRTLERKRWVVKEAVRSLAPKN